MKLENLLQGVLLFTVIMFSGITFYGNMVSEYNNTYNVTSFDVINESSDFEGLMHRVNGSMEENLAATKSNVSGLQGAVAQVPVIGDAVIGAFSTFQIIAGFVGTMFDTLNIAMDMITEIFAFMGPAVVVPNFVKTALYTSFGIAIMFAIVALIWKWQG